MENYNFLQKILHDLLLSNKFLKKTFFEIEKILFLKKDKSELLNTEHVFITSLPRSGTTILLNILYDTNNFTSLTYNEMPFVMAPNLFSKFGKNSDFQNRKRLHNDGILFNLSSPEAFDEIFFSTFSENETLKELVNFIIIVLENSKQKRYLSKNNLNYKRIDLIKKILPKSIFLIPVREPLQQSYSLLNQHNNFCKIQKKNPFIRRYMKYLGHHEFGIDHISWFKSENYFDYNDINYWLEQWLFFYENVYKKYYNTKNCYFIKYENLSNLDYVNNLFVNLNLEKSNNEYFEVRNKKLNINFDSNLYEKSKEIYNIIY